jgi:superfamily II DNA/RNA helicase
MNLPPPPSWSRVPSLQKNFYREHPDTRNAPDEEIREWWRTNNMTISGTDASRFKPIRTFEEAAASFPRELMSICRDFTKPTAIQSQSWPIALSGRDLVGIAETGSGKTIAFAFPGIVHILNQPPVTSRPGEQGPIMLILSPTRELALQTAEVCEKAGGPLGLRTACLYGGVGKNQQRFALRQGLHIAVATPGRLLDLIQEGRCTMTRVSYLVLDEADRMLDMGFERDIRAILGLTRPDRQTLMFSATWPPAIQRLASDFQHDPVRITIGSPEMTINKNITQIVEVIENPMDLDERLHQLLQHYHKNQDNRILIFVDMKKEAARLDRTLRQRYGWRSQAIHGDLDQNERTRVMRSFKDGSRPLLIATDVAARGLDIPDVEYVINYAMPANMEDYVHRIGRTGRAGKHGVAHSFFLPEDRPRARELIDLLRKADQKVPPELEYYANLARSEKGSRRGGGGRPGANRYNGGSGGGGGGGGGYGGGGGRGPVGYVPPPPPAYGAYGPPPPPTYGAYGPPLPSAAAAGAKDGRPPSPKVGDAGKAASVPPAAYPYGYPAYPQYGYPYPYPYPPAPGAAAAYPYYAAAPAPATK